MTSQIPFKSSLLGVGLVMLQYMNNGVKAETFQTICRIDPGQPIHTVVRDSNTGVFSIIDTFQSDNDDDQIHTQSEEQNASGNNLRSRSLVGLDDRLDHFEAQRALGNQSSFVGDIFLVRECLCARGLYCILEHDYCGVAKDEMDVVGCFGSFPDEVATGMQVAWAVALVWFLLLVFSIFSTEKGRYARQYIYLKGFGCIVFCGSKMFVASSQRRWNENYLDYFLHTNNVVAVRRSGPRGPQRSALLRTPSEPSQAAAQIMSLSPSASSEDQTDLDRSTRHRLTYFARATAMTRTLRRAMLISLRIALRRIPDPPPPVPTSLTLKTKAFVRQKTDITAAIDLAAGESADDEEEEEDDDCMICYSPLEDGDRVGALGCTHVFHVDCLKTWLVRRNVCPLCQGPEAATPRYRGDDERKAHLTRAVSVIGTEMASSRSEEDEESPILDGASLLVVRRIDSQQDLGISAENGSLDETPLSEANEEAIHYRTCNSGDANHSEEEVAPAAPLGATKIHSQQDAGGVLVVDGSTSEQAPPFGVNEVIQYPIGSSTCGDSEDASCNDDDKGHATDAVADTAANTNNQAPVPPLAMDQYTIETGDTKRGENLQDQLPPSEVDNHDAADVIAGDANSQDVTSLREANADTDTGTSSSKAVQ